MYKGKDYSVKKDAHRLKNNQESEAVLLKEQQALVASDLTTVQANRDSMNNSTVEVSRKRAASALLSSQNKAAAALKESNEDHARVLKKAHQSSKEKMKEKDSFISWMSGGYSVDNKEE